MSSELLLTIKLHHQLFVDPKRIALLRAVRECGSINQAAKNVKVSYKSAWDHLQAMNEISPQPLLERATGGKNGGGTQLTRYAERLLQLYALLEKTQEHAFSILQDENIPLDNLLSATARFAPQSSARNQFFGKVSALLPREIHTDVEIEIANLPQKITACITAASARRLGLTIGKEVMLMIKAPWIKLHSQPNAAANLIPAEIRHITATAAYQEIAAQAADCCFYATAAPQEKMEIGQQIWLSIDPEQIVLLTL